MNKARALKTAIEVANNLIASADVKGVPYSDEADSIADFIERLTSRLENMGEID